MKNVLQVRTLVALAGGNIPECDTEGYTQILSLGGLIRRTENWKIHMVSGDLIENYPLSIGKMSCLLALKVMTLGSLLTTSRILALVVEDNEYLVVPVIRRRVSFPNSTLKS